MWKTNRREAVKRAVVAIAAALCIWIVGTAAAVASVLSGLAKDATSTQVSAVTAVVQASTAIAVVGLTVWLALTSSRAQQAAESARSQALEQARIAQEALGVAQRQADLAEDGDRHARRDRQLLETPRISVKSFVHGFGTSFGRSNSAMTLIVFFLNESERPALNLRAKVWRKGNRNSGLFSEAAQAGVPIVEPGIGRTDFDSLEVVIADFESIDSKSGKPSGTGLLTHPWLAIQLQYEGVLGQQITDEYSYWADGQGSVRLFRESTIIVTSVPGAESFEIKY